MECHLNISCEILSVFHSDYFNCVRFWIDLSLDIISILHFYKSNVFRY